MLLNKCYNILNSLIVNPTHLLIGSSSKMSIKIKNPLTNFHYVQDELNDFKSDTKKIGKVIYLLNNLPKEIFKKIFLQFNKVCPNLYLVVLTKNTNTNTYTYNFSDLYQRYDNFVSDLKSGKRYICIKINIDYHKGSKSNKTVGHVNIIIIDINRKFILFFDSSNRIDYDIKKFDMIINTVNFHTGTDKLFTILKPSDIGYSFFSSLQGYNLFCQTYIFLVLLLIISNKKISHTSYKLLFDNEISNEILGLFLFYIYKKIEHDDNFKNIEFDFYYPGNYLQNIINSLIFKYKTIDLDNNLDMSNVNDNDVIAFE